jgi:6-pyruvoyltetrahydropterin/6-carboxytetrahydropterin synthase
MRYELSQKFYFEAAHTLHREIDAEGSRRIHGHTYHCEITLHGVPDPTSGMLADLAFVRREIERVRRMLDHRFLDEVKTLGPATLENLCQYLFRELRETMPELARVSIERPASGDRCSLSI